MPVILTFPTTLCSNESCCPSFQRQTFTCASPRQSSLLSLQPLPSDGTFLSFRCSPPYLKSKTKSLKTFTFLPIYSFIPLDSRSVLFKKSCLYSHHFLASHFLQCVKCMYRLKRSNKTITHVLTTLL